MKKERNYLAKLFARKSWRRVVRSLSCLVVFCTTYALILPAFTTEAKSYCGHQEHEHGPDCYKQILSCPKEEHTHTDECFDTEGNLICNKEEHVHGSECYRELLDCTTEIHEHSLICFSNPNADLESAADWEKSLPTREERKETTRENVVATAWSQQNVTESRNNYQVDNETDIRGISRYGQWDQDPYEDNWSGSFARFVMHYGGVKDDTDQEKHIYPDKDLIEWMNNLSDHELLVHIDEAREGDIVFINDSEDEIRAGVILDTDTEEGSFRAMMGDWMDQVSVQKFFRNDSKIHSAFLIPVDDDPKEEEPDDSQETENSSKDETEKDPESDKEKDPETEDKENTQSPNNVAKPSDQDKTDQDNPDSGSDKKEPDSVYTNSDKDQISKTEEAEKDKNLTVLTTEADDGTLITATFGEGTFSDENIKLLVKRVELTEEENIEIHSKLNGAKDYKLLNYDITFYRTDNNSELVEVEPEKDVDIVIQFPEIGASISEYDTSVFHKKKTGQFESMESQVEKVSKEISSDVNDKETEQDNVSSRDNDSNNSKNSVSSTQHLVLRFRSDSFSVYTVATSTETSSDKNEYLIYDRNKLNSYINYQQSDFNPDTQYLKLANDIEGDQITVTRDITLDLNGFTFTGTNSANQTYNGGTVFSVENNSSLTIYSNANPKGHSQITYKVAEGQTETKTNIGRIRSVGSTTWNRDVPTIVVEPGSSLKMENVAVDGNLNYSAIQVSSGQIDLTDCYLVQNHKGIFSETSNVVINGGAIADNQSSPSQNVNEGKDNANTNELGAGAGIYAKSNSHITLDGDAKVAYNRVTNSDYRIYGGGITVRGSTLDVVAANVINNEIRGKNYNNGTAWVGGGGIAALAENYVYKVEKVNGQDVGTEYTWNGTAKPSEITLYPGANISGNYSSSGGGGIFLQGVCIKNDVSKKYADVPKLYMMGGVISNNIAQDNEGGGIHMAAKYVSYAYLFSGEISYNKTYTPMFIPAEKQHFSGFQNNALLKFEK